MSEIVRAEQYNIKFVAIWKVGQEMGDPYAYLTDVFSSFQYVEDLFSPSISGTLVILDKALNLPADMPITGFEKVVIAVSDNKGDDHQFDFRVWKIGNRVSTEKGQAYTLGLIGDQGLTNEGVKVNKVLTNTASGIVNSLLIDYLNVPSAKIKVEESLNTFKIIPAGKSPFAVIRDLQAKAISKETFTAAEGGTSSEIITGSGDTNVDTKSDNVKDSKKLKGTAGYFFWEDRDGFNFKSVDSVVSPDPNKFGGSGKVAVYSYEPANVDETEFKDHRKIQEVVFRSEIDMMKKLREGAYSTECAFFDINTGVYTEYTYKLSESWDEMAHLGPQTKLPKGQEQLSQYPTRRLSSVINHENWYNGTEVASNDASDQSDEPSEFYDSQKQYLVQSISRVGTLFNQQLAISVTGNLDLRVGQKIEVQIPNQVPLESKEDLGSVDPEHSGIYLIRKLNHQFDRLSMSVYTVLELIRDSWGYEDTKSDE